MEHAFTSLYGVNFAPTTKDKPMELLNVIVNMKNSHQVVGSFLVIKAKFPKINVCIGIEIVPSTIMGNILAGCTLEISLRPNKLTVNAMMSKSHKTTLLTLFEIVVSSSSFLVIFQKLSSFEEDELIENCCVIRRNRVGTNPNLIFLFYIK